MNQTLEGHEGGVVCLAWNPHYRKLTSSDQNGLIIVWMLHKGMWYEEMINNRNKSYVTDMKWTPDGKKICIAYADGYVIVGSVDGSRIWGKELSLPFRLVEWSPDAKHVLFVSNDADVVMYESDGATPKKITPLGNDKDEYGDLVIAGLHWYGGAGSRGSLLLPSLCIAFTNGIVQLSRGDSDPKAIIIDTEMTIKSCRWNPSGSVIAFIGYTTSSRGESTKTINNLKLYDPMGMFLRTVRIPGENVAVSYYLF
jgi:WD repeat-containing protein 35